MKHRRGPFSEDLRAALNPDSANPHLLISAMKARREEVIWGAPELSMGDEESTPLFQGEARFGRPTPASDGSGRPQAEIQPTTDAGDGDKHETRPRTRQGRPRENGLWQARPVRATFRWL